MDLIPFFQQELGKITSILTGNAGDQCAFHVQPHLFRLFGLFNLVCLVFLVYLVFLVCLVYLVCLVNYKKGAKVICLGCLGNYLKAAKSTAEDAKGYPSDGFGKAED